jgi:BirA family biotin operon repressor/biotin-[acetyl-CoA-carboxylase] ligase
VDSDRSSRAPETLEFDKLGSTNDVLLRMARNGLAEHSTVVAREETRARGGNGRWQAPRGGLWMSTLWKPDLDACRAARLTLAASLAVRAGIRQQTGVEPGLKWPNDLVVDGDKLGGVIVEGRVEDHDVVTAAVGIGVNVNNPVEGLPGDLGEDAVALHELSRGEVDLDALRECVAENLANAWDIVHAPDELVRNFNRAWTQKGQDVEIDAGHMVLEGTAKRIDDDGALVLEGEGTEHRVEDPSLAKFVRILD